jgi:hypothetical protein
MTSSPILAARSQYLLDLLAQVPDPRKRPGRRHALAGLLAVGIAAVVCHRPMSSSSRVATTGFVLADPEGNDFCLFAMPALAEATSIVRNIGPSRPAGMLSLNRSYGASEQESRA